MNAPVAEKTALSPADRAELDTVVNNLEELVAECCVHDQKWLAGRLAKERARIISVLESKEGETR